MIWSLNNWMYCFRQRIFLWEEKPAIFRGHITLFMWLLNGNAISAHCARWQHLQHAGYTGRFKSDISNCVHHRSVKHTEIGQSSWFFDSMSPNATSTGNHYAFRKNENNYVNFKSYPLICGFQITSTMLIYYIFDIEHIDFQYILDIGVLVFSSFMTSLAPQSKLP